MGDGTREQPGGMAQSSEHSSWGMTGAKQERASADRGVRGSTRGGAHERNLGRMWGRSRLGTGSACAQCGRGLDWAQGWLSLSAARLGPGMGTV